MILKNLLNSDDIVIEDGKDEILDCSNCIKVPLSIDLNVKNCESISTLYKAGLNGGVGSFLMIPKSKPIRNKLHLEYNLSKAKTVGAEVMVAIEGISDGKLNNIAQLVSRGAKAIFINSDEDMNLIRRVFEYSEMLDVPVFVNCFNNSLAKGGVINDSKIAYSMGLGGIPNYVESVEVAKILELSNHFSNKVVFQSITTKESLEILKNRRDNIFIDVTIDNLLLIDEDIENFNTLYKTMPPLRSIEDKMALLSAVEKLEVDFISSNHLSVSQSLKDLPFEEAEYGISKLDIFSQLVYGLGISYEVIEQLVAKNPAKLFDLESDRFMVIEFQETQINEFYSKGKNHPYKKLKSNIKFIHIDL